MFGMALRTYHRRERAVAESQTDTGRTVWDAVLEYVRQNQPVAGAQIARRFHYDDDWQMYDTQVASYEFEGDRAITWEGRSCTAEAATTR